MFETKGVSKLVGENRVDIDAALGVVERELEVAFSPARIISKIQDECPARFFGVGDLANVIAPKRPFGFAVDPNDKGRGLRPAALMSRTACSSRLPVLREFSAGSNKRAGSARSIPSSLSGCPMRRAAA